jgi:MtN3 and saliva related transmembrane protein
VSSTDVMGLVAATLTTGAFFPQVVRTWRLGGEDLSYAMLGIFLVGVVLWLVYGAATGSLPIVTANVLTAVQVVAILILKRVRRARQAEAQ